VTPSGIEPATFQSVDLYLVTDVSLQTIDTVFKSQTIFDFLIFEDFTQRCLAVNGVLSQPISSIAKRLRLLQP
jgi:hypothetical protein